LEGDSSLPNPDDALLAKLRSHANRITQTEVSALASVIFEVTREFFLDDIPRSLWATRKTLDLFGNDYYLAHIYRTLHWWTKPTHVTVLGDLIGSQWVSDDEFEWRGRRYWERVLAGSRRVDDEYMTMYEKENGDQHPIPIGSNTSDWQKQVINIAGNHDIGYAGDISFARVERFERIFGKLNWDIKFEYSSDLLPRGYAGDNVPSLHMIILNSMLLDTPALNSTLQMQTFEYLNNLIVSRLSPVDNTRNNSFTLLLTHVPLHKEAGVCTDGPFVDYWDFTDANGKFEAGGLKEQNHLSQHVSEHGILQAIFGLSGNLDATMGGVGRKGLILNGHDHEGCDVVHYVERYNATPVVEVKVEVDDVMSPPAVDSGPWKAEDFLLPDQLESLNPDSLATQDNDNEHRTEDTNSPLPSGATSGTPISDPHSTLLDELSTTTPASSSSLTTLPEPTATWRWKSARTTKYPPPSPPFSDPLSSTIPDPIISLREITLRSMMGSYSGNAGLLSLWFNYTTHTWEYSFTTCAAGVQHIWWAVHVVDIIAIMACAGWVIEWVVRRRGWGRKKVVVKRVRMVSYVRERPKGSANGVVEGDGGVVGQVRRVDEIKEQAGVAGRARSGGNKRRVYSHVVR